MIAAFFVENEPLQRLPAANSVLKRTMFESKNALNVSNRKLLEILIASQMVSNTADVNQKGLTNLLLNSLNENVNECKYFDIPI